MQNKTYIKSKIFLKKLSSKFHAAAVAYKKEEQLVSCKVVIKQAARAGDNGGDDGEWDEFCKCHCNLPARCIALLLRRESPTNAATL